MKEFVLKNLRSKITLKDAASVACAERTYFSKRFKERTEQDFSEWLRDVRLDQAKALLVNTDAAVKEVARMVWYGNSRALERAFRIHLRTTASEYRRNNAGVKCCE